MKISLNWVLKYIDNASLETIDLEYLIEKFNSITAEIEGTEKIEWNLNNFFAAQVIEKNDSQITAKIFETNSQVILKTRSDAQIQDIFLVYKKDNNFFWAGLDQFEQERATLIPALDIEPKLLDGSWKKFIPKKDVILEVDNKSITHRPDMWSHYGFAREIAYILGKKLISQECLLSDQKVEQITDEKKADNLEVSFQNQANQACKSFCLISFSDSKNSASNFLMAFDLIKVGAKPINALVDLSNFLMLDWGQPNHAYDADKISKNQLIARMAQEKEKIILLDGEEKELTNQDLVIADDEKVLGLAGIMGSLESGIDLKTKNIIFESANFDATTIRKASARHKVRTESSSRFEKTLSIQTSVLACQRFLKLAEEFKINVGNSSKIMWFGKTCQKVVINITHEELEKKIGIDLDKQNFVKDNLEPLGFKIEKKNINFKNESYDITVPHFRSSKDVLIPEDIVEEVARCYGFDKIEEKIPALRKSESSIEALLSLRALKKHLSFGMGMIEQWNYPMFDEDTLKQINFKPVGTVNILNPVSQNAYRMATTLIPGLLKNVKDNLFGFDQLKFFESARVWEKLNQAKVEEKKVVSGLIYSKQGKFNFYDGKEIVDSIYNLTKCSNFQWGKINQCFSWMNKSQTAEIKLSGQKIGFAGMINEETINNLGLLKNSSIFVFEIDQEKIIKNNWKERILNPINKFQNSYFDLSILVSKKLEFEKIKTEILKSDSLINKVELIDKFEKNKNDSNWSLALRVWLENKENNLSKTEIDFATKKIISLAENLGAQVR